MFGSHHPWSEDLPFTSRLYSEVVPQTSLTVYVVYAISHKNTIDFVNVNVNRIIYLIMILCALWMYCNNMIIYLIANVVGCKLNYCFI